MKILIVTPLHPTNKFNGASQRIRSVIRSLVKRNVDVRVIYTCQDLEVDSRGQLDSIKDTIQRTLPNAYVIPSSVKIGDLSGVSNVDDCHPADILSDFQEIISDWAPDAVLVNYVFLSRMLLSVPNGITTIIDTHDKLSRKHIYESANLEVGFFCTTEEEEILGLKRADHVICIQENEAKYFSKKGVPSIVMIGHLIENVSYLERPSFRRIARAGFLGSAHVFNTRSVDDFLSHSSFPELSKQFQFTFAGSICNQFKLAGKNVTKLGRVESPTEFYNSVDLIINPVLLGTGLKIKTVEALSYGMACVGTDIAFDGIRTNSKFHTAKNLEEFTNCLFEIAEFPQLVPRLANHSKALSESYSLNVSDNYEVLIKKISEKSNHRHEVHGSFEKKTVLHHVVNAVETPQDSDLFIAQPITFESMHSAKKYSMSINGDRLNVKHHIVFVGNENCDLGPLQNVTIHRINRTIGDFVKSKKFKPLPILSDILECVANQPDDDYVIYTNADISLTPSFYEFVHKSIQQDYDGLVINRRTISNRFSRPDQYAEMSSEIGLKHPGYDCFVFKVSDLKKFRLQNTVVGVHLIGRVLLWNLVKFARNPQILKEAHLTFHIGDDNAGKDERNNELVIHNFSQAVSILEHLFDDAFCEDMNRLAPDALRLSYKPNIPDEKEPRKTQPIFIHSMFRTGSTYLWNKLRQVKHVNCFYEPLHETLYDLSAKKIDEKGNQTKAYHKRLSGANYWELYRQKLKSSGNGVEKYKRKFAYYDYGKTDSTNSDIKDYINNLCYADSRKKPILQFNRTALRQSWFTDTYCNSVNIYLLREPRSQFHSYYQSYVDTNRRGFLRTQYGLVDQYARHPEYSILQNILPLPLQNWNENTPIHKYFNFYDTKIKELNRLQLYALFYADWLLSLKNALYANSHIINMTAVSQKVTYRRRTEFFLLQQMLYIDLDDCAIPEKTSKDFYENEYVKIEQFLWNYLRLNDFKNHELFKEHHIPIQKQIATDEIALHQFNEFLSGQFLAEPQQPQKSPTDNKAAHTHESKKESLIPLKDTRIIAGIAELKDDGSRQSLIARGSLELEIDRKHLERFEYESQIVIFAKAKPKLTSKGPLELRINQSNQKIKFYSGEQPIMIVQTAGANSVERLLLEPISSQVHWELESLSLSPL